VVNAERAVRGEPPDPTPPAALMMRIENFRGEAVWYRKPSAEDRPEDKALRERAAKILTEHKTRREKFIGAGKPGIVELLRDWFCARDGGCAAANAELR
jgi:hypothetical protein